MSDKEKIKILVEALEALKQECIDYLIPLANESKNKDIAQAIHFDFIVEQVESALKVARG